MSSNITQEALALWGLDEARLREIQSETIARYAGPVAIGQPNIPPTTEPSAE